MLFLAVWWVWVYTSWITNWLNPEPTPVRHPAVPADVRRAGAVDLDPEGFRIAGPLVCDRLRRDAGRQDGISVGFDAAEPNPGAHECGPDPAWLSLSAVFWIAGGLAKGHSRLVLWAVALTIEYISPAARFWIPKYGASAVADWVVEGGHMAERCAGFIIIALGESIVVTGATFADLPWTTRHRRGLCRRPSSARSRCGGSISTRAPKPAPSRFQGPANRGGWRGSPIPICTCRSWPASFSRRSPTTSC